jgi:pectate lyase
VTPGRKYRLRLESMGRTHRVYVDERLVLTAYDASHTLGTAGLRMYRTSADFDNVIVSPSPQATIFAQDFNVDGVNIDWSYGGSTYTATQGVYRQSETGGDAKAIAGAMTEDSIVRARIRPTTLLAGNSWVGLLARGKTPGDYVYVSLRANNTVTLRRLVSDNNVYPIAEVPYTVTPGNWYSLRLEIVAGLTRVIVNDKVVIATNTDYGSIQRYVATEHGSVGLVSYRAAADYDDFLAYQP